MATRLRVGFVLLLVAVSLLVPCCATTTESSAMLALQAAWSPPGWNSSTNFCTWSGVACLLPDSEVYSIEMNGTTITGIIPSEIGSLSFLQYLDLSNQRLYGSIPSLGQLTTLTLLDLSNNLLSGPISAALSGVASLRYLNLRDNFFTGDVSVLGNIALLQCDLTSNPLDNCNQNYTGAATTCSRSCSSSSLPVFSGPCGTSAVIGTCSNGTGIIVMTNATTLPGSLVVAEPLILAANATLTISGVFSLASPSNFTLEAPLEVGLDFTMLPSSIVSLIINSTQQPVDPWITVGGCAALGGSLVLVLTSPPPSPLRINVTSTSCYSSGFASVTLVKEYFDNPCFTTSLLTTTPGYDGETVYVVLQNLDCSTTEIRRLIIFGAVFGGIGLLVTLCIVSGLGYIRFKERREGRLIDDQL